MTNHSEQRDRALLARIEAMDYEGMVRALRFAPIGDPMFLGKVGDAFHARLSLLKAATSVAEQVAVSKRVGLAHWGIENGKDK